MLRRIRAIALCALCALCALLLAAGSRTGVVAVEFGPDQWELGDAEVTSHLGRKCIAGAAHLKDVEFKNGVIEFDIAVDGSRSYPGIMFRVQSEGEYEQFYLRPHRAGLYPDALQYTPVFNGVAGWQLYHGDGFTAGAEIPIGEWVHVRLEVKGTQARVYVGEGDRPALVIDDLKHGISRGSIGLVGERDGSAYFSDFRYELRDDLTFDPAPQQKTPQGTITEWEVSRAFKTNRVNPKQYPSFFTVFLAQWKTVHSEPSGLVDVSRYVETRGSGPDCVLARKVVQSDSRQEVKLSFGYSDEVTVFLNGRRVFWGNSAYRSRDRSFLGVVGLNDAAYLTLEKGRNEILLIVAERFGGWGFMARADRDLSQPAKESGRMVRVWETADAFKVPESVLYDEKRDILYVSSFDKVRRGNVNTGFISRVTLSGKIEELEWVAGLDGPCGMGIYGGKLYVVESGGALVEIDIKKGQVVNRYEIEGSTFLNDLAVGPSGDIFITDTSRQPEQSDIYRFHKGKFEVWKAGDELHRANGLFVHDGALIVGNSGDGFLKSIDLADRRVGRIACLGGGVIDGIRVTGEGVYIVSHWEGQTYLVTPTGDVTQIGDTMSEGLNAADFEYVANERLLIVPTFLGNKVVAYRIERGGAVQ
jgi:sugar lactone lactonase YvrE